MSGENATQTLVALVTVVGTFTTMIVSVVTGRPIPPDVMTLVTVAMSGVIGWFFGTRGAIAGAQAAHEGVAATAAAVAAATAPAAEQLLSQDSGAIPAPDPHTERG